MKTGFLLVNFKHQIPKVHITLPYGKYMVVLVDI